MQTLCMISFFGNKTHEHKHTRLESKDLVLELADGTGLFEAEALGGLFETANHGRRTAEQDLDVIGGLGEEFLLKKNG